ncbi:MAG: protein kinase, partial [Myxococcota bacterium]
MSIDSKNTNFQEQLGIQFGKYSIFSKVAIGGMAEIFLARQEGLGGFSKTVVLKCILPHLAKEKEFITMFLDEARVAALLTHPNIVQIYDIDEHNGIYFIAMEYVKGYNLGKIRRKILAERLPDDFFRHFGASLIVQAAAGLEYAHSARDDR